MILRKTQPSLQIRLVNEMQVEIVKSDIEEFLKRG